jgi:hypothetical protein
MEYMVIAMHSGATMRTAARWLALGGLIAALAFATVLTVRGAETARPALAIAALSAL